MPQFVAAVINKNILPDSNAVGVAARVIAQRN
jgi:serine acetyltransferase